MPDPHGSRTDAAALLPRELPILALRDSVLFPGTVAPVSVGRPLSVAALQEARQHPEVLLVALSQRQAQVEQPGFADLYAVGTLVRVRKVMRMGASVFNIIAEGIARVRLQAPLSVSPFLLARFVACESPVVSATVLAEVSAALRERARVLAALVPEVHSAKALLLAPDTPPERVADLVATHLSAGTHDKQQVLACLDPAHRVERVQAMVERQMRVQTLRRDFRARFEAEMSRPQREALLRQQMRHIRRELGETEDEDDEVEQLRSRVDSLDAAPEVLQAARHQLRRMRGMPAASPEFHIARAFVEWLVDLPWRRSAPERLDVRLARAVLDEDHFGLEQAKTRIVEHLAVRKLRNHKRSPILCLVGAPGVGKSSVAKSIARATGRPFARVALGGVQDES
ncbi:MAG: LON peptidase substrate-binding domain-containing protein, partial [Polyangiales bacterium]